MLHSALKAQQHTNDCFFVKIFETVSLRRQARQQCFKKKRVSQIQSEIKGTGTNVTFPHYIAANSNLQPYHTQIYRQQFYAEQLDQLLQNIQSQNLYLILRSAVGLRKLTAEDQKLAEELFQKVLTGLIKLGQMQQSQVRLQATWCLANISTSVSLDTNIFLDSGCMSLLLRLVQQSQKLDLAIFEHVLITLANVTTDSPLLRDYLLDSPCIDSIIQTLTCFQPIPESIIENACWAIARFCRATSAYPLVQKAVKYVSCVLVDGSQLFSDPSILTDCLFLLAHHINIKVSNLEEMKQIGVLQFVLDLCGRAENMRQRVACLRIIGNFAVGSAAMAEYMLQKNLLQLLSYSIKGSLASRRETCWILSNLVLNPIQLVKPLLSHKTLFRQLAHLAKSDHLNVRKEICHIFANLALCLPANEFLNFANAMEAAYNVSDLLSSEDETIVEPVLQCLSVILEALSKEQACLQMFLRHLKRGRGDMALQRLQQSKSRKIYKLASRLIMMYFEVECVQEVEYEADSSDNEEQAGSEHSERQPCMTQVSSKTAQNLS